MRQKTRVFKSAAFCLLLTIPVLPGMQRPARAELSVQSALTGKLTVVGKVTVDEKPAATGDVFISGSTASTARGSSAVVSLGKLGRFDVLPSSTMKIGFIDSSISGLLHTGSAKITTAKGTSARVSIKDGEVVADGSVETVFSLATESGNTCVHVSSGYVQMHAGTRVEKITAGKRASIGRPCPQ